MEKFDKSGAKKEKETMEYAKEEAGLERGSKLGRGARNCCEEREKINRVSCLKQRAT